jgi:hypothetical protein
MTSRTTNRPPKPAPQLPQTILTEAQLSGMLPLDYMLGVMRDPAASPARRDRMATCAAQYCHPRAADTRAGKRAAQAKAAKEAGGAGSGWGDDLQVDGGLRRQ